MKDETVKSGQFKGTPTEVRWHEESSAYCREWAELENMRGDVCRCGQAQKSKCRADWVKRKGEQ